MNIDFENEVLDFEALREEQQLNENILNVFTAFKIVTGKPRICMPSK